jgi:hypothetical protein
MSYNALSGLFHACKHSSAQCICVLHLAPEAQEAVDTQAPINNCSSS